MTSRPAHLRRTLLPAVASAVLVVPTLAACGGHPPAADPAGATVSAADRAGGADWSAPPPPTGLDARPEDLLPARVSEAEPARIVSVVRDAAGRPVVAAREATDRATAVGLVAAAQRAPGASAVEVDVRAAATAVDPYLASMWPMATLAVTDAWQLSTGAGVTVAVIDSGVAADHPDLAGVVLPGLDTVAAEGDGRIDPNGHGTHVAGTIAALTGNGVGVAGVAPGARILPVRTLDANGSGWMSNVATGITWAADHGADVVNLSLSSAGNASSVAQAVAYARSKGVTVVAAAGNYRSSGSPVRYPAANAGVIAVAATDANDVDASFSNQNDYVDVAAPGVHVWSTVPGGGYQPWNGTSMASPHVAAAAALLKAAEPGLNPDGIEHLLTSTALDLGAPGRDDSFGHGRIRPAAALAAAVGSSPTPSATPTVTPSPTPSVTPSPTPSVTPTPTPSVTPSPTPSAAPTPVRPTVQVSAPAASLAYGAVATTRFRVRANGKPWASRPAAVCVATSPAWNAYLCSPVTTSATGTVTHTRKATAGFRIFLRVSATTASPQVRSRTHTSRVRPALRLSKAGPRALRVQVTGATGQRMAVQRRSGHRWVTVATFPATRSRKVTKLARGYAYRLSAAATPRLAGHHTGTVRL